MKSRQLFFFCVLCGMLWQAQTAIPAQNLRTIQTSAGSFRLGKRPYAPGTREAWIREGRALGDHPASMQLQKATPRGFADNRAMLPPIGNQGSEGSCVHWAGTYYTKTAAMKRHQPSLDLTNPANQCSPRFTYNQSNGGFDSGNFGHEPFDIFVRYGSASLDALPFVAGDYQALPPVNAFIEGLHRRTASYVWLWDWQPGLSQIDALKAFLDAGGVAACAVSAGNEFSNWQADDPPFNGPPVTYGEMNHMVTVCGYDATSYLIANSWGSNWGSNGFIRVASSYFENYVSDIMYPIEGNYTPVDAYLTLDVHHYYRSQLSLITVVVNGTTVWSNSPLPGMDPLVAYPSVDDARDDLSVAVDISSASWQSESNCVDITVVDGRSGTIGSIASASVTYNEDTYAWPGSSMTIPDNNPAGATIRMMFDLPTSTGTVTSVFQDFDGDGKTDLSVYEKNTASWYLLRSSEGMLYSKWGWHATKPVSADYDGDGKTDIASFLPSKGNWYILPSETGEWYLRQWGWRETTPVPADYDGDGKADLAVFYQAIGRWYILASASQTLITQQWGWRETEPVPADYDGDGKTDLAVYYRATGKWYILPSVTGVGYSQQWGWRGTEPLPADYDGDGKADLAIYNRSSGKWYIQPSATSAWYVRQWGWRETDPVPGDYDGDGKTDLAVYLQNQGYWYVLDSSLDYSRKLFWGWQDTLPPWLVK